MTIFRATLAALLGAFLALALYLIWFFGITHHDTPWNGETLQFMVMTGAVAVVFGFAGGFLAAVLAPLTPHGVTDAVAALIAIAAIFADRHTPGQHHWAQLLALFVMAPAAYAAGRTRRPLPRTI